MEKLQRGGQGDGLSPGSKVPEEEMVSSTSDSGDAGRGDQDRLHPGRGAPAWPTTRPGVRETTGDRGALGAEGAASRAATARRGSVPRSPGVIQIGGEGVEAGRRGGCRDERQPGSVGPVQFRPEGQGKPQVVLSRRKERSHVTLRKDTHWL